MVCRSGNILLAALISALVLSPGASAWAWPVAGPVLRPFVSDGEPYGGGQHRGIDIGAPMGSDVRSATSGVVAFAGRLPRQGLCLTVRTADGWSVTLVHLGSIGVTVGTQVGEGDVVGTIGPSGEPEGTEPYVYLGIRLTAGPERLRRPRDASASPTAAGAATPGAATAAGAGCGSARSRAARGSITPRAPSVRGAGTGPSGGSIRGEAASCGPEAGKHGDDSSYPWCASTECSTSASSSPWSCSCLSRSDSREPDASARTAGAPRRSGPAPSSRRDDARGSRRAGAADAFEAAAPGPSRRGRPRARGARRRRPATSPAPCRAPIRAGAPP